MAEDSNPYSSRSRETDQVMSNPSHYAAHAKASSNTILRVWTRKDGSARDIAPHSHSRGQLLGTFRGLMSLGTERGEWVVPSIHAAWIPPHQVHSMRSHGPFSGWSVFIAESACTTLPSRLCSIATSGLLREAILRAATWDLDGKPLNEEQTHIATVIFDEIRKLPRERSGLPMPKDQRLRRITSAIADNPADNRRLEDWAKWATISTRTLSRRFTAETGFCFTEWRQQVRLLRALELLSVGTSVTTIAFDLGYETVSAFIAMFRRKLGVTPTRYLEEGALNSADTGLPLGEVSGRQALR